MIFAKKLLNKSIHNIASCSSQPSFPRKLKKNAEEKGDVRSDCAQACEDGEGRVENNIDLRDVHYGHTPTGTSSGTEQGMQHRMHS